MSPMHKRTNRRAAQRGMTLIEAMVAMAVILVGLLGFMALQIVTSRANTYGRRMAQASALATNLAENTKRWPYDDGRLTPATLEGVTSISATSVQTKWDLGRGETCAYKAHFSDKAGDTACASATQLLADDFQGLAADVDGDGEADFTRYWNVYKAQLSTTTPTENGKFVQIIVRWREPGVGYRQVTTMAYKPNPGFIFQ